MAGYEICEISASKFSTRVPAAKVQVPKQSSVCHWIGELDCYVPLITATVTIISFIYKHRKIMAAIDSRVSVGITVWTFPLQMYVLTLITDLILSGLLPELL